MNLTSNERAMLRAAARVSPKRLALELVDMQEDACRLDGRGLMAVYEGDNSDGVIYATITIAGREAIAKATQP